MAFREIENLMALKEPAEILGLSFYNQKAIEDCEFQVEES
jgi:hypothetical protein